jgi:tripartite-type tricarboxylate transporter receptor subunit TctC
MRALETIAVTVLIGTVVAGAPGLAAAQTSGSFPEKPVRLIVPFTAGAAADILARRLASSLAEVLGQQVVVDNRPGAGGTLGANIVAKASPDGYTLLVHSAAFAVSAALYSKLPYDPNIDFAAVSQIAVAPIVLVVGPSLGAKSVKELLALSMQKPGQITFGSSGVGSSTHFAAEQFKLAGRISVTHVPYKGPSEALLDTMTGRIHYALTPVVPTLPFIKDKRLLALAVTTGQRTPVLPEVPTVAEAGLAGFEYQDWWGLFAPARTPQAVIEKINKKTMHVLAQPEVARQMLNQGAEPRSSTPEQFASFVRAKIGNAQGVVRLAGIPRE